MLPFHYYIDDDMESMTDEAFSRCLSEISEQRREKVLRFKFKAGQIQSLKAYLLVKKALSECYGITSNPVFRETEHGKPMIKGHEDIHFNISHCKTGVACAIADKPIGIDIEHIRGAYDKNLINYVFNHEEARMIEKATNPQMEFTRLWTMKESLTKMTGTGLCDSEQLKLLLEGYFMLKGKGKTPPFEFYTIINEEKSWVASVCYSTR